jgi:hypothetical protein
MYLRHSTRSVFSIAVCSVTWHSPGMYTQALPSHVLGPVPGIDVMAMGPQGWVQCEDRLPCYKDNSCVLPLLLLLSMMSSNNRGDLKMSLCVVVVRKMPFL